MRSYIRQGTRHNPTEPRKIPENRSGSVGALKDRKIERLKFGKFTSTESAEFNNHKDFPALCKAKKAGLYDWRISLIPVTWDLLGFHSLQRGKWYCMLQNKETAPGTDNTAALCWTRLLNECPTNHAQEQSFSFQRREPYFCVNLVTCISHSRRTRRCWVFSQWVSTSRSLRQPWVMWDFVLGQSHSTLFILCAHNKVLGKQNERGRSKIQNDFKELQVWATALYRVSFMVYELYVNKAACIHTHIH